MIWDSSYCPLQSALSARSHHVRNISEGATFHFKCSKPLQWTLIWKETEGLNWADHDVLHACGPLIWWILHNYTVNTSLVVRKDKGKPPATLTAQISNRGSDTQDLYSLYNSKGIWSGNLWCYSLLYLNCWSIYPSHSVFDSCLC